MTGSAVIDLRQVSHAFSTPTGPFEVSRALNLPLPKASFTSVVGPSGCGKSTLTRLISGLVQPTGGEIWLDGSRVTSPRSNVGMAFQNPVMLEWRNVMQNIMLPLEIVAKDMPRAEQEERACQLL
ncbi:MAG: ATP-binding cassette domain-containing protein, partial [Rhodobacteraceae bacterium]|nr:ATP-binding cassette domain-containing protein [Paracoccaceae bacterium]